MKNLKKIKGDASFREFFRKKNKNFSSIIVFAIKEKSQNLINYDAINRILNKNKILAPKLINENFKNHYIEIQDFGNETIHQIFIKKNVNKFEYFKKIIILLNKIQSIRDRKTKNFKNKIYKIPKYDKKILSQEANLFCDWYIKKKFTYFKKKKFLREFKKVIKNLTLRLKLRNNIFVHRDFHISNIMSVGKQIGVIDSQDALIGNQAYDLASLIDDVRFKTSKSLKNKVYKFYIKKQKNLNVDHFKNDFDILSVLRNLKIIGIFSRLAIRDGKKKYLRLIPYTWELIHMRINKNIIFQDLKDLLNRNFDEN